MSRRVRVLLAGACILTLVAAAYWFVASPRYDAWPAADTYVVSRLGDGVELSAVAAAGESVAHVATIRTGSPEIDGALVLPWKPHHSVLWLMPANSSNAEIYDVDDSRHEIVKLGQITGEGTPVIVGDLILTVDETTVVHAANGVSLVERSLPDLKEVGTLIVPLAPGAAIASADGQIAYYLADDPSVASSKPTPMPSASVVGTPDPAAPAPQQPGVSPNGGRAILLTVDLTTGRVATQSIDAGGAMTPTTGGVAIVSTRAAEVVDNSGVSVKHDLDGTGQAASFLDGRLYVAVRHADGGSSIEGVDSTGVVAGSTSTLPGMNPVRGLRAAESRLLVLRNSDVCILQPGSTPNCQTVKGDIITFWP